MFNENFNRLTGCEEDEFCLTFFIRITLQPVVVAVAIVKF